MERQIVTTNAEEVKAVMDLGREALNPDVRDAIRPITGSEWFRFLNPEGTPEEYDPEERES